MSPVLTETKQLRKKRAEPIKVPPAPAPKSKKTVNVPTTRNKINTAAEVRLSTIETWLLSPKTFWRHLCTNRTQEQFIQMFVNLSQHGSQEVKKVVVAKANPIPQNYMAWVGQFADDDPETSAFPALAQLMEKVYKAKLYAAKFPRADILFSWSPAIRMGFDRADYTDSQIEKFLEVIESRKREQAMKTSTKTLAITMKRNEQVQSCLNAAQTNVRLLQYEAKEREARKRKEQKYKRVAAASGGGEEEQDPLEALEDLNIELRKALASMVTKLNLAGVVSRKFQKFAFDTVNKKPFDISYLEDKDREFLIADTGIVRARNTTGKLIFQLNDLCD